MSKQKKHSASSVQVDNVFDVIEKALRSTGRLLPENEDDAHRSESSVDIESVSLPKLLQDPMKTLNRGRAVLKNGLSSDKFRTNTVSEEIQQDLKHAARNGGIISEEIKARLSKDRAATKKKATYRDIS